MKNFLLFFLFIYISACSAIREQTEETAIIDCPRVFFSSENKIYIDGYNKNIDLEKMNYKASLNNYGFDGNCFSQLQNNNYNLDILIILEPLNLKTENVNLPIFVLLYDLNNKLIDKQYFRITDRILYNENTSKYEITDIIGKLKIINESELTIGHLVIGFVKIN